MRMGDDDDVGKSFSTYHRNQTRPVIAPLCQDSFTTHYCTSRIKILLRQTMLFQTSSSLARRAASTAQRWANHPHTTTRWIHIEKHIEELGLELPPPAPPRANYNSVCQGPGSNMMFLSGHLPFENDGKSLVTGRIGEENRDVDFGYQAARRVGLGLIATLKDQLGDLDRVEKVVKVCMRLNLIWKYHDGADG